MEYTEFKFAHLITWPLYEEIQEPIKEEEADAAARAFADYIWERR